MRRTHLPLAAALGLAASTSLTSSSAHAQHTAMMMQAGGEFPASYYYHQGRSDDRRVAWTRRMEGRQMPALTLSDWTNGRVSMAELRGKVVVVDFWGTWCGPCMNAVPHNVQLVNSYSKNDFAFIGVHTSGRGWDRVQQTIRDKNINYPVAQDVNGQTIKTWGVTSFPTYAVIDRKGTVRGIGLLPNAVDKVVEKLLAEPAPEQPATDPSAPQIINSTPEIPEDWLEGNKQSRTRIEELLERGAPPAIEAEAWLNSPPRSLPDLKGKVVLVQFWSPTRQACLRLLPELQKLHESFGEHGLVVIGVTMPVDRERVERVVADERLTFAIAFDDDDQRIMKSYEANGLPDTFFIDRAGTLRIADIREEKIKDAVRKLLAEPDPTAADEDPAHGG